MKSAPFPIVALVLGAACATPNPPSVTSDDVDRAFAEARYLATLPATASHDLPTGSVTYDGHIGADIAGDARGQMLADMTMNVRFDSHAIAGTVRNINLLDTTGLPEQRLDGNLTIAGFENAGQLGGVAAGQVSGVNGSGEVIDTDMILDLNGSVIDDQWYGDAVYGSATGSATGDVNLGVNGVFFGTER